MSIDVMSASENRALASERRHDLVPDPAGALGAVRLRAGVDQVGGAGGDELAAQVDQLGGGRAGPELRRALDRARIAAESFAVIVEHLALVRERLGRAAGEVPLGGVLRRDLHSDLLAAAADDERRVRRLDGLRLVQRVAKLVVLTLEVRFLLGPE